MGVCRSKKGFWYWGIEVLGHFDGLSPWELEKWFISIYHSALLGVGGIVRRGQRLQTR